ncbi:uncharacterized protein N0V89_003975 [Didymosphaeria variabile]|uniref:AAA+ ATPase domain-containing protein n=1 Tax=Didymosphaeria variabile TaxID=1932322 RepID=A0A9W8XNL4_9PLEO|nr:uncharacterized protein N0V89_003975 [Didymosphaeria variabile]KAJ4355950.1 hypothetical protein N0V89_003975 [Didymosphaeria variabile]
MYGALRSGLRASHRRRPARFISHRRYPLPPARARAFHASRGLAQDNNPPADPDNKPSDSKNGERKKAEGAAARADNGEAVEDADMLAQKLQRSREMTRRYSSALRRSQRRNRAQDLPPVVVPSWFVNECVRLSDDAPDNKPLRQFVFELQRRGTDETGTCAIPINAPGAAVQLLSDFLFQAWGGGLGSDEKRRFARQWAASLGLPESEEVLQDLEIGGDGVVSGEEQRYWLQKEHLLEDPVRIKRKLEIDNTEIITANHHFALSRQSGKLSDEAMRKIESVNFRLEATHHSEVFDPFRPRNAGYIPPFVKAEIHAAIAASLSASQPASSDNFPAAKTNLILHCPSNGKEKELSNCLANIAREQGADIVSLNAQDLAEIAGDYLGDLPDPSPHSIRSLAYETYRLSSDLESDAFLDEAGKEDFGDEQEDSTPSPASFSSMFPKPSAAAGLKMPISIILPNALSSALKALQTPNQESNTSADMQPRSQTPVESQLEDLKIGNVLEHLIDASETKRSQNSPLPTSDSAASAPSTDKRSSRAPRGGFFSSLMTSASPSTSTRDEINIDAALPSKAITQFNLTVKVGPVTAATSSKTPGSAKIVYIPDYKELNATHYGGRIIQKLEEIIRKRRLAGERIMMIGSTSSADLTPEFSKNGVQSLQSEGEASFYRTIVVPVERLDSMHDLIGSLKSIVLPRLDASKYRRINVRHIFDMLRRLDPVAAQHLSARETGDGSRAGPALASISGASLSKILTYDEVHRIALTALGLHAIDPTSEHLTSAHVALAIGMLQASDQVKFDYVKRQALLPRPGDDSPTHSEFRRKVMETLRARTQSTTDNRDRDLEAKLEKVSQTATKHEKRLMPGIANPAQIKTTFDQIHVPTDTVDSIRTLTSLSLLRPDAFNYGVLATEKISGALLYGPPGTGKTLLAKAVAKESGSTVLEVSGSQIMDKYVGEGEKNVTAIFSLARKLSPCIVFLDEADAIFSSRDVGRERTSHRDILNQFLKEWDGLNDLSVFVMVATNRPFDLDDAVIRRLPRRLLVDLPTEKDRAAILKIHLRGEELDESVDLNDVAKRTPFYSGSDLKNLAVSAALACVKEENEQAAIAAAKAASDTSTSSSEPSSSSPDVGSKSSHLIRGLDYKFPDKRILSKRHFDAALQEISASISENMSSLNAIKKFDEKYGDKKGKKTKHIFGIGVDKGTNEDVVRVRP